MQIIAERKERSVHIELWLLVRGVCHYYLTLIHKMIYQLRLMETRKIEVSLDFPPMLFMGFFALVK